VAFVEVKIMPLGQLEQLPDLVWLSLASNFLEVQEFGDSRVDEDVMAAVDARQAKPKRLREGPGLGEPEVVRRCKGLLEKFSRFIQGVGSRKAKLGGQQPYSVVVPGAVLI
jgi:hypothetical protein